MAAEWRSGWRTPTASAQRSTPTAIERVVMRAIHRWSVPSEARSAVNPVAFTPEAWAESCAHFADHCASCHGNNGRGDTEIGRSLFPKAPDMRPAAPRTRPTRALLDHRNGIR